eukprot:4658057-Prymnesium_polylepis.1
MAVHKLWSPAARALTMESSMLPTVTNMRHHRTARSRRIQGKHGATRHPPAAHFRSCAYKVAVH